MGKKWSLEQFAKEVRGTIRQVDALVKEATGIQLTDEIRLHIAKAVKGFGDSVYEQVSQQKNPYSVLGVSTLDPPETIKAVYKTLVKIYHEAGANPNPDKMKEINTAYEFICRDRGWAK